MFIEEGTASMKTVGAVCRRDAVSAAVDAPVATVAALMRQQHVGAVVIVDAGEGTGDRVTGILTDRDLVVEVLATGLDPSTITAGDIMRRRLVTVSESSSIEEAVEAMRDNGVRRLPVVDEEGSLAGIVAADDILGLVTGELENLTRAIARSERREIHERK